MIVSETADKIKSMEIRGQEGLRGPSQKPCVIMPSRSGLRQVNRSRWEMGHAASMLLATRPTAVSLPNAVHIVMAGLENAKTLQEARPVWSSALMSSSGPRSTR